MDMEQSFKTREEYLKYYYEKYGTFMMAFLRRGEKKQWWYSLYNSDEYKDIQRSIYGPHKSVWKDADHRYIFPNEVVIDLDNDNRNTNKKFASEIEKRLMDKNISYSRWFSGGKGYHFHLWYPELSEYSAHERKILKELIIKNICYGLMIDAKIDLQLTGKHLIRCEYGLHVKYHREKELENFYYVGENVIPKEVLDKLEKYKEKSDIKIMVSADVNEPACIKFFKEEDFMNKRDGRKRALFILTSWYINKQQPKDVYELLQFWNRYTLNGYLRDMDIKSTIRSNKGQVGCRYRKAMLREFGKGDLCKNCPFNRSEYYKGKEDKDKLKNLSEEN